MRASVRLDHQLLAVEGEHDVHAMLELSLPELAQADERRRFGSRSSSTAPAR